MTLLQPCSTSSIVLLGGPGLHVVLQMMPHIGRAEEDNPHSLHPAFYSAATPLSRVTQDIVGLSWKHTSGLYPAFHPQNPSPSPQGCSQESLFPACAHIQDYPSQNASTCAWPCWTLFGSCGSLTPRVVTGNIHSLRHPTDMQLDAPWCSKFSTTSLKKHD